MRGARICYLSQYKDTTEQAVLLLSISTTGPSGVTTRQVRQQMVNSSGLEWPAWILVATNTRNTPSKDNTEQAVLLLSISTTGPSGVTTRQVRQQMVNSSGLEWPAWILVATETRSTPSKAIPKQHARGNVQYQLQHWKLSREGGWENKKEDEFADESPYARRSSRAIRWSLTNVS